MNIDTKSLLKLSGIGPCLCGDPSCSSCGPEYERQVRDIAVAVLALNEATTEAMNAVSSAHSLLDNLTGKLWDIELAEGTAGDDAARELDRAGLSLRHVSRIVEDRIALLTGDAEAETPAVAEQPEPSGLSEHGEPCEHPNHREST